MLKENVTIVIPTYERQIVNRAVNYYVKWDVPLIVCDSSAKPLHVNVSDNLVYLHTPEKSFSQKLYAALCLVSTPYCCIASDDDFLSYSGIKRGVDFLENNLDYVSVQGHYIEFTKHANDVHYNVRYGTNIGYCNVSASPSERIITAFNPYVQHFYSLHRTPVLKQSLNLARNLKSLIHAELSTALVGMIYGKHRILPFFWMARDNFRHMSYTNNNTGDNNSSVIWGANGWKSYLLSSEAKYHKELFAREFSQVTGEKIEIGNQVFERAFGAFISGLADDPKTQLSWKDVLKKLIPKVVLEWRRAILDSPVKRQKQSMHIYQNTPGFPWTDVYANADWQNMKSVIMSFPYITSQINDNKGFQG